MKKIIHVSNFNLIRLKGCFQVGFPFKISNGLIRNGYSVLNYPDRDLCRMFGFGHMNFIGRNRLNKHLINFCKVTEPDAILIGHADLISNETLFEIKRLFPALKIMQWSCDWIVPGYAERNIKAVSSRLEAVDMTLISTGDRNLLQQFKCPGKAVGYLPNMADDSLETGRAFEHKELPYDMMLCANTGKRQFCGRDEELESIIDEADRRVPGLKWKLAGIKNTPALNGYAYIKALGESAMGFNLSRLNDIYLYSSDRMVHAMANGQLTFLDRRNGFQDLFSEEEAVFYETPDEFYDKLKFYKNNPQARMKIAAAGHEKIHREYSNVAVTKYMAELLFGEKTSAPRPWQILLKD